MATSEDSMAFSSEMDDCDDITVTRNMGLVSMEDSIAEMAIFKKPKCLIYNDKEGLLAINNEVLSQISQIECDLNVVGVCGLYRTGKSYLMNRLAGEKTGFALGGTIQSETKGIWVWCQKHSLHTDRVIIFVDTEGLDDPDKDDQEHDDKLFCLTHLLSSTLIINVSRVLDVTAFKKLACIARLSDSIQVLSQNDVKDSNAANLKIASPHLIMCIRDFYLKPEKNGKLLTMDEYLEDCLQPSSKTGRKQEKSNSTKESIKQHFPKRKCFTMAQPATGKDLQNIEALDESSLQEQFVKDSNILRDYVLSRKPKYICNASKKTIDGADLASLITTFVGALRKDTPIDCEFAYGQACEQRNENALRRSIQEFQKEMNEFNSWTSKEKLQNTFLRQFEQTLTKYREKSFLYRQNFYEERVITQMMEHLEKMKDNIKSRCQSDGDSKLSTMYNSMVSENWYKYTTTDGFKQYEDDMSKLENDFKEQMKHYDDDDVTRCLLEFKNAVKDDRMKMYNDATGKLDKSTYRDQERASSMRFRQQMDTVLNHELEMRSKYLMDQMEELQNHYKDLHEKFTSKRSKCLIM